VAEREQGKNQGRVPGNLRHRTDKEGWGNVAGTDGQIGEFQNAAFTGLRNQ